VNNRGIQRHIDRGRGKAALRLGMPHSVYRLQNNTSVNYLDPANIVALNVPIFWHMGVVVKDYEGPKLGPLSMEVIGDFTNYEIGDVFIRTDPYYGQGSTTVPWDQDEFLGFALASHAPVHKTLGGWLNHYAMIYRPEGAPDANGYYSTDTSSSQPLALVNGIFTFEAPGSLPAFIPSGWTSHERLYGMMFSGVPTSTPMSRWLAYLPVLPGYVPREGDRIQFQDGSSYVVIHPYAQNTGFVGSQIICDRVGVDP
jgi:hypothetical protein